MFTPISDIPPRGPSPSASMKNIRASIPGQYNPARSAGNSRSATPMPGSRSSSRPRSSSNGSLRHVTDPRNLVAASPAASKYSVPLTAKEQADNVRALHEQERQVKIINARHEGRIHYDPLTYYEEVDFKRALHNDMREMRIEKAKREGNLYYDPLTYDEREAYEEASARMQSTGLEVVRTKDNNGSTIYTFGGPEPVLNSSEGSHDTRRGADDHSMINHPVWPGTFGEPGNFGLGNIGVPIGPYHEQVGPGGPYHPEGLGDLPNFYGSNYVGV